HGRGGVPTRRPGTGGPRRFSRSLRPPRLPMGGSAMGLDSNDLLLGRIAVHAKLISSEQLNEATLAQGRSGGRMRLGEILVDKGFVTPAQLEKLVAAQPQGAAQHAPQQAPQGPAP